MRGGGRTGTVPVFTVFRSMKEEPDSVPAASPRLPRSTSPWSPGQPSKPTQEFPARHAVGAHRSRPISARFEPVRALRNVNAGSLRTPFHPARRTRTIWQCWHVPALSGPLATLPVTTRIRLPPAPPSCCDRIGGEGLSPPLESTAPHGALNGDRKLTPLRRVSSTRGSDDADSMIGAPSDMARQCRRTRRPGRPGALINRALEGRAFGSDGGQSLKFSGSWLFRHRQRTLAKRNGCTSSDRRFAPASRDQPLTRPAAFGRFPRGARTTTCQSVWAHVNAVGAPACRSIKTTVPEGWADRRAPASPTHQRVCATIQAAFRPSGV